METIKRTKISVAVITYNQESTIRQTLDSILAQKGDFDLEVIVGEDCSKDSTGTICDEIANRVNSEELIGKSVRVLHTPKNLGIMANFARVIVACTGDYIADIAGDDFYCDDDALAKQLAYMQSHPEVGVLAANGYSYYIQRNEKVPGLNPEMDAEQKILKDYYFSPTHLEGVYLAPVGMMYRGDVFREYIDLDEILRRKLPVEDFPIQAILSQHTKFACLPDLIVTYRVYKESASFMSYNHPRYLEYYRGLIETRRYLNELFPDDAVSETILQERMFYKEWQYDVYHLKYREAKELIASASPLVMESESFKNAKRYTRCWLQFAAYNVYKKIMIKRNISKQI